MDTQQPPRERARRLAPEQRRAALLDAATELFIVQGPNFTTADLATAAGVSEGTIFRYFTDKSTLVAECRRCAIGLDELVPEIGAAAELPTFREQVLAASRLLNDRILQMIRVVSDGGVARPPDDAGEIAEQLVAALAPIFDGLSGGAPAGRPADGLQPEQLANMLIGMLISNTFLCEKTSTDPVPVERLVDLFLHGIDHHDPDHHDPDHHDPGGSPTP